MWVELVVGLSQGLEGWCGVMSARGGSPDSLCRWWVQISVYCARRIPAHCWKREVSTTLHSSL